MAAGTPPRDKAVSELSIEVVTAASRHTLSKKQLERNQSS
jgi:hypothetical protein